MKFFCNSFLITKTMGTTTPEKKLSGHTKKTNYTDYYTQT